MKNNLKRIAIILPVIALLLAFFAVPAAAEGIDGGYIDTVTYNQALYAVSSGTSGIRQVDVTLGEPFILEGGASYLLTYVLQVDVDSLIGSSFSFPSNFVYALRFGYDSGTIVTYLTDSVTCDGSALKVTTLTTSGSSSLNTFSLDSIVSIDVMCEEGVLSNLSGFDYTYYTLSSSPTEPIGNVWTGIMTWITSALTTVMGAFYVDGSLTLLGTLACIGVSVGIGFLLIGLLQRFLKLRG